MGIELLTERHKIQVAGVLSCHDRRFIYGTVPGWCYASGVTSYLFKQQMGSSTPRVGPRLVAAARLHSRKSAHHPRMLATLVQNGFHSIYLPETFPAPPKFDLYGVVGPRFAPHVFA